MTGRQRHHSFKEELYGMAPNIKVDHLYREGNKYEIGQVITSTFAREEVKQ